MQLTEVLVRVLVHSMRVCMCGAEWLWREAALFLRVAVIFLDLDFLQWAAAPRMSLGNAAATSSFLVIFLLSVHDNECTCVTVGYRGKQRLQILSR